MSVSTFQTNPVSLQQLLQDCHSGALQLPDFQRSWVWDEERIKSLIASISRSFPVGALMTLKTGGAVNFKPRPVEGAPEQAKSAEPQALLLDGQQRMTSFYQVTLRNQVVETVTPNNRKVKRWFYLDMLKALDDTVDRDEAIVGVPEDKVVRTSFGREVALDLSTPEHEYAALMYPVTHVFDSDQWLQGFYQYWVKQGDLSKHQVFFDFKNKVLEKFKYYQVPVIALDQKTSKEAVCVVFEKVNTGGKPLDAFELVTAMYAADGYELRKDWYGDKHDKGLHGRLAETLRVAGHGDGILSNVSNTDFLHVISLFHTRERRREAEEAGKQGKDLPAVIGNRQALLSLPLSAYKEYKAKAELGFERAAKFLHMLHIYRTFDLPYQTQIVPLAAILADIGHDWEHADHRAKLVQWYWCGVFGELYGSAVESRSARDFLQVPGWLHGGPEPSTVSEATFRSDRLKTMRMRLSAAYKGVNALLMEKRARDWISGQEFGNTVFFDENVDIHHIFPQRWCKDREIKPAVFDSIINKAPLSFRTNRIIGGDAPSEYLKRIEVGSKDRPSMAPAKLDEHLRSHYVDPDTLRKDDFAAFMQHRQQQLQKLIGDAMGKPVFVEHEVQEGIDMEIDADLLEAEMVMPQV